MVGDGMKVDWIGNILSGERDHQSVELKGWVHRSRGSNKMRFVVLRDSTGTIQCVVKRDIVGDDMFEDVKSALIESSIIFKGTVIPTEREHGHEIQVENAEIVGPVNPDRPYPITESVMDVENLSENAFLLDNRHLYLRTERMTRMLKIRSSVFGAIHQYFRKHDFTEYQAPNFVAGAVEGGSTLFEVPYFPTEENPDRKAYLTQSWQLYAEAAMPALEKLYTIAPSFRAEKSRTTRHLSEFWHAEMEIAWAGNDDVMKHGEAVVRNIAQTVLDERESELTAMGRDIELISKYADNPYPRIRYDEAVETLQGMGVEIEWGQDLDYSKEKILTQDFEVLTPHSLPEDCKAILSSRRS